MSFPLRQLLPVCVCGLVGGLPCVFGQPVPTPEVAALQNLEWRELGPAIMGGRIDDMINYDGLKILPSDIEDALLSHPAVLEAVAFPLASSVHHHLPAAAVILRQPASNEELFEHCRKRLGVRSPLIIAIENDFPRNPGGKVLRTELAAKLSAQVPLSIR